MNRYDFAKIHLPYAIQKMNDSIGGWIILNRNYKPLGTTEWCIYENIPAESRIAEITYRQQLLLNNSSTGELSKDGIIFLYSDATSPHRKGAKRAHVDAYNQRLDWLGRLKTLSGCEVCALL
jgi:hypothetical protein